MPRVYDFHSCAPQYHAVTPSCGAAPPPRSKNALGCSHSSHYTSSLEGWYCRLQGLQLGRTSGFSLPGSCVAVSAIANTGHQGGSMQLSSSMFSLCPTFKTRGVFIRQILPSSSDEHPKSVTITCAVLEVPGDFWPLWFAYEIFLMFSCFRHWVPTHGPSWESYGAFRRWMMVEQSMWLGVDFDSIAWSHPLPCPASAFEPPMQCLASLDFSHRGWLYPRQK